MSKKLPTLAIFTFASLVLGFTMLFSSAHSGGIFTTIGIATIPSLYLIFDGKLSPSSTLSFLIFVICSQTALIWLLMTAFCWVKSKFKCRNES